MLQLFLAVLLLSISGEVAQTCGNGILETGEECDDGNTTTGDGCSDLCRGEDDCVMVLYDTVPIRWRTEKWVNIAKLQEAERYLQIRVVEKDETRDFLSFVSSLGPIDLCAMRPIPDNGLLVTGVGATPGTADDSLFNGTGDPDELGRSIPTGFSTEAVAASILRLFSKNFNDTDYTTRLLAAEAIPSSLVCPASGTE